MTRHLLVALLISVFGAVTAFAQEPSASVCNAAFEDGIRNNYQVFSKHEHFQKYQSRLCEAGFSSYDSFRDTGISLGLTIPVAETIIDLEGSLTNKRQTFSEKYNQFCSSSLANERLSDTYSEQINRVSSDLAEVWLQCQNLHLQSHLKAQGVYIDVRPSVSYDKFVVTVHRRSDGETSPVVIKSLSPEGEVSCIRSGDPVQYGRQIQQNRFEMTCQKDPNRSVSFSVDTNDGPSNAVTVPREAPLIAELRDSNRDLQTRISELEHLVENQLDEVRREIP